MHRKLILSIICLLGLSFTLFAQQRGQVSGVIKDAESGETLVGVSVYEEQLQVGTTTNEAGRYALELPYGEHHLRISYVGYSTLEKKVTIGNKPVTLNLKLQPESEKLSEVEVAVGALRTRQGHDGQGGGTTEQREVDMTQILLPRTG